MATGERGAWCDAGGLPFAIASTVRASAGDDPRLEGNKGLSTMNTVPRDPKDNVSLSHGRRGPTSTWDILDLLEKCFPVDAIECSPPAIEPPPPSGLVPFVPSFECIERDVMYINGCVYRIGASPEGPAQGAVHTASVIYAISPLLRAAKRCTCNHRSPSPPP
jgi:hypothetical protein